MSERQETIADIIAEKRRLAAEMEKALGDQHSSVELLKDDADHLEAAYKREKAAIEADALSAGGLVEAMRQKKATAEKSSAVGNAAKLREALEYPKDANDKYIHIGDAVHMLNTNHEGDHEWDDVVLSFEYVGKGGGDDWLVYGEDGAAWACECEVLKQEGGNNADK